MYRMSMLVFWGVLAGSVVSAMADAQGDFNTLFGEEIKRVTASRDGKASAELAAQILKTAGTLENRPDLDLLMWRSAADLGAKDPSGYPTATKAIKQLIIAAPDETVLWVGKLSAIHRRRYALARGDDRLEVGRAQAAELTAIADAQLAAGRSANALMIYRKALSAATVSKSDQKTEILAKIRSANAQGVQEREIQRLIKILKNDPDNVKTRTAIVNMYVLALDNPAQAAKYLNDDLDEMLRTYVLLAGKNTEELDAPTCLGLGRWYWELYKNARTTQSKIAVLRRTRAYVERFESLNTEKGTSGLRAKLILKNVGVEEAKLDAKTAVRPRTLTKPVVMYDFESPRMTGWKVTGNAFGKGPCAGKPTPSYPASGFAGRGMISSYHGGDPGTGTLTSPKFVIRGNSIRFLVGGGRFPGKTCMNLIVSGKVVRTVVGNGSNTLGKSGWDVSDLVGKTAQLQMVDTATSGWGHILVDHIVQHPDKLKTPPKTSSKSKSSSKSRSKKTPYRKKKSSERK